MAGKLSNTRHALVSEIPITKRAWNKSEVLRLQFRKDFVQFYFILFYFSCRPQQLLLTHAKQILQNMKYFEI